MKHTTIILSVATLLCLVGATLPACAGEAESLYLDLAIYRLKQHSAEQPKQGPQQPSKATDAQPASTGTQFTTLADAMRQGRNVVVYFDGGPTCKWCKRVDQCLEQPAVAKVMNQYSVVKLGPLEALQFGITEFPSVLLLSSDGKPLIDEPLTMPHTSARIIEMFTP